MSKTGEVCCVVELGVIKLTCGREVDSEMDVAF
jgi:hypothetical protein